MEFLLLAFQGTDPSVRYFFFYIIMPGLLGFHILPFFLELENVESGVAKLFNYYYIMVIFSSVHLAFKFFPVF